MATFQEIFADATPGPHEPRQPNGPGMGWKSGPAWFGENSHTSECEANAKLFALADLLPRALDLLADYYEGTISRKDRIATLDILAEARRRIAEQ